jgi:hypothetical protein
MKRFLIAVVTWFVTVGLPPAFADELEVKFSADAILSHVRVFAHESLLGRRAGTPFERRAVEYISRQLDAMNVDPFPPDIRTQSFPLNSTADSPVSANVLGYIGPENNVGLNEIIVLGAHLDHLGQTETGGYYPGADDNASGVAIVLEVAAALQRNTKLLRRPVVVVFFGAEEIGLIGSSRFVRDGPISHEHIAAMVNIDMFGRPLMDQTKLRVLKNLLLIDSENGIGVVGTAGRPLFARAVEESSGKVGLKPYGAQAAIAPIINQLSRNRSDHSPFERVGIPTLFFSSGPSDDYHQPSDTIDKLSPTLMARRAQLVFSTVLSLATAPSDQLPARENAVAPDGEKVKTLKLQGGALVLQLQDNSASPRVLSGLQSLSHTASADFDAFDPDSPGSSAGLNFEHIISGHRNRANRFTPRSGKYDLHRLPDGRSAMLVRKREDGPWDMSSTLKYTVQEPHYIDFEFRCTPHSRQRFGTRGHAICFFANYMNDVEDPAIHFLGVASEGEEEAWISSDAPNSHPDWTRGGTFRHVNATDVEYDDNHEFRLNSWSYDSPRFTKPFYFGRAENDMVFMLMFDRDCTREDEIRFSLFKFKLPKTIRPAWDFQYVIHKVTENKRYGFHGRLVWKPWVSRVDCLSEYNQWRRSL